MKLGHAVCPPVASGKFGCQTQRCRQNMDGGRGRGGGSPPLGQNLVGFSEGLSLGSKTECQLPAHTQGLLSFSGLSHLGQEGKGLCGPILVGIGDGERQKCVPWWTVQSRPAV